MSLPQLMAVAATLSVAAASSLYSLTNEQDCQYKPNYVTDCDPLSLSRTRSVRLLRGGHHCIGQKNITESCQEQDLPHGTRWYSSSHSRCVNDLHSFKTLIEQIDAGVQSFDGKVNLLLHAHSDMKEQLDAKKRINERMRLNGRAIKAYRDRLGEQMDSWRSRFKELLDQLELLRRSSISLVVSHGSVMTRLRSCKSAESECVVASARVAAKNRAAAVERRRLTRALLVADRYRDVFTDARFNVARLEFRLETQRVQAERIDEELALVRAELAIARRNEAEKNGHVEMNIEMKTRRRENNQKDSETEEEDSQEEPLPVLKPTPQYSHDELHPVLKPKLQYQANPAEARSLPLLGPLSTQQHFNRQLLQTKFNLHVRVPEISSQRPLGAEGPRCLITYLGATNSTCVYKSDVSGSQDVVEAHWKYFSISVRNDGECERAGQLHYGFLVRKCAPAHNMPVVAVFRPAMDRNVLRAHVFPKQVRLPGAANSCWITFLGPRGRCESDLVQFPLFGSDDTSEGYSAGSGVNRDRCLARRADWQRHCGVPVLVTFVPEAVANNWNDPDVSGMREMENVHLEPSITDMGSVILPERVIKENRTSEEDLQDKISERELTLDRIREHVARLLATSTASTASTTAASSSPEVTEAATARSDVSEISTAEEKSDGDVGVERVLFKESDAHVPARESKVKEEGDRRPSKEALVAAERVLRHRLEMLNGDKSTMKVSSSDNKKH